jgi:polar amino acid transport system substrate-binding protein
MRIGVTIGNYYSDEFDRLIRQGILHTDGAADDLSNFRKLLARRIDLFPIEEEVGQFLLGRHFTRGSQLQHSQPFWLAPMHVVIWKKHPHGAELIARFNRGLLALQRSGELAVWCRKPASLPAQYSARCRAGMMGNQRFGLCQQPAG